MPEPTEEHETFSLPHYWPMPAIVADEVVVLVVGIDADKKLQQSCTLQKVDPSADEPKRLAAALRQAADQLDPSA